MNVVIGNVVIGLGTVLVLLGLLGVLRFKDFYLKLLSGAKIDSVGLIAIVTGAAIRSGWTWFTAKALLILAIVLLVNPIVTSTLAAGARRYHGPAGTRAADRMEDV